MIANNMCFSTRLPECTEGDAKEGECRSINGLECIRVGTRWYAQSPQGVFPCILKTFGDGRKAIRRQMKEEGLSQHDLACMDAAQLSYKLCANSIYGYTGAAFATMDMRSIASGVTGHGRWLLEKTKACVEERFKGLAQVVYGDSVSACTLVHVDGRTVRAADVFSTWEPYCHIDQSHQNMGRRAGKETARIARPLRMLTSNGYLPVLRGIRHRYRGKMYRICFENGSAIRVTADHQLFLSGGGMEAAGWVMAQIARGARVDLLTPTKEIMFCRV